MDFGIFPWSKVVFPVFCDLASPFLTGGELIQVPGTCINRVKLIDPGFSKIKKVMGVLVLKTFSLYILYGGKNFFLYGTTP